MTDAPQDQESVTERRRLQRISDRFLLLLQAQRQIAEYDGTDDFARSIDEAYAEIRARVAGGGKGWTPP